MFIPHSNHWNIYIRLKNVVSVQTDEVTPYYCNSANELFRTTSTFDAFIAIRKSGEFLFQFIGMMFSVSNDIIDTHPFIQFCTEINIEKHYFQNASLSSNETCSSLFPSTEFFFQLKQCGQYVRA